MGGEFKVGGDGRVEFRKNEDGMDFNAVTTNIPKINPGGNQDKLERVPFLFTVKQLKAQGTLDSFAGDFLVPSYRGATFLDPKVGVRTEAEGGVGVTDVAGQVPFSFVALARLPWSDICCDIH